MARPRLRVDIGRVVVRGPLSPQALEALRGSLEKALTERLAAGGAVVTGPVPSPAVVGEAAFVGHVAARVAGVVESQLPSGRGNGRGGGGGHG